MIPPELLIKAKSLLAEEKRPLFFHDDDCDGTASFVICYQFCKEHGEGRGIPIKRSPAVGKELLRKVEEFNPDLIVILDKPKVDPEFLEGTKLPVLWIDHHEPQEPRRQHVTYLNPRVYDDNDSRPTSYWVYKITGTNLWLATIGCVADWYVPDFLPEFQKLYPDLVPQHKTIHDLYLGTQLGTIIRVIQFNLKGQASESKKSVLTLTRIESPYEILNQTTSRGKFLWRKYEHLAESYDKLLIAAQEEAKKQDRILAYIYEDDSMTFTSELSNELLIRYPKKIILVARHHGGAYKCSVRSSTVPLPELVQESLKGLEGYGGGHRNACGVVVAEKDWTIFLNRFSAGIEKST
jgi:single-stranded DNA-specific DHH superfamily exonuclease